MAILKQDHLRGIHPKQVTLGQCCSQQPWWMETGLQWGNAANTLRSLWSSIAWVTLQRGTHSQILIWVETDCRKSTRRDSITIVFGSGKSNRHYGHSRNSMKWLTFYLYLGEEQRSGFMYWLNYLRFMTNGSVSNGISCSLLLEEILHCLNIWILAVAITGHNHCCSCVLSELLLWI